MNTFHLATIPLVEPVTIYLPAGHRPLRVVAPTTETGTPTTLTELECAFWVNLVTQTIHAQIARLPHPLLIYNAEDFAAVATDLPAQHGERVLQCLGSDPAAALQALVNGIQPKLPPHIPREIQNWRAKAVLAGMGLLDTINAAIEAMPEPDRTVARLAWHGDAKLARRGKTVLGMAAALGLTGTQVDALFTAAAALEV